MGQVLVDAGHSELDLVTDALLGTFCCVRRRDAEEQQHPEGVGTELGVHLRGTITTFTSFTLFVVVVVVTHLVVRFIVLTEAALGQ